MLTANDKSIANKLVKKINDYSDNYVHSLEHVIDQVVDNFIEQQIERPTANNCASIVRYIEKCFDYQPSF